MRNKYWVFPSIQDIAVLDEASILEVYPALNINMLMSTNRLIVMELLNDDVIASMSRV